MEQYQSQLEVLANRIEGLTESFMASYFLGGLKEDIRLIVKIFKPSNLSEAFGLARIQEEKGTQRKKPAELKGASHLFPFNQQLPEN